MPSEVSIFCLTILAVKGTSSPPPPPPAEAAAVVLLVLLLVLVLMEDVRVLGSMFKTVIWELTSFVVVSPICNVEGQ